MQYGYKDWIPSQSYYAFATAAGCPPSLPYGAHPQTIFDCLVGKDSQTLISASARISQSGTYGTWGFLPVTDGIFVQDLPSQQLLRKRVNGIRALIGNNAEEGPGFTPQNITTEADLVSWLQVTFPLFTNDDIAKVLLYYPSTNASVNSHTPLFATSGDAGASALNESSLGSGQQQRADVSTAEGRYQSLTNGIPRTSMPKPPSCARLTGWQQRIATGAEAHTSINSRWSQPYMAPMSVHVCPESAFPSCTTDN